MAGRHNGRDTMGAVRAAHAAGALAQAPDQRARGAHGDGAVGTRVALARPSLQGPQCQVTPAMGPTETVKGPQVPDPRLHVEHPVSHQGPQVPSDGTAGNHLDDPEEGGAT